MQLNKQHVGDVVRRAVRKWYPDYEKLSPKYLTSENEFFRLALEHVGKAWGTSETRDFDWVLREIRRAATLPFLTGWKHYVYKLSIKSNERYEMTVEDYACELRAHLWSNGHTFRPQKSNYSTWLTYLNSTVRSVLTEAYVRREYGVSGAQLKNGAPAVFTTSLQDAVRTVEEGDDLRSDVHDYRGKTVEHCLDVKDLAGRVVDYLDRYGVTGPRVRRLVVARFGLDGEREQTLEEIGRREKLSKERVRQVVDRFLARAGETLFGLDRDQLKTRTGRSRTAGKPVATALRPALSA